MGFFVTVGKKGRFKQKIRVKFVSKDKAKRFAAKQLLRGSAISVSKITGPRSETVIAQQGAKPVKFRGRLEPIDHGKFVTKRDLRGARSRQAASAGKLTRRVFLSKKRRR